MGEGVKSDELMRAGKLLRNRFIFTHATIHRTTAAIWNTP
jgi:hypothetical protein